MRVRRFVKVGFLAWVGTVRPFWAEAVSSGMDGVGFAGLPSCDLSDAVDSEGVGDGRCARAVLCPFMSCLGVEKVVWGGGGLEP